MWRTGRGYHVLRGAEWELFKEGMGSLWDFATMDESDPTSPETGITVFDRLETNQKLALLALVGKALRDEAEPAPELTAYTEGTVAAVYGHIYGMIEFEIDYADEPGDDPTYWRRLALDAARAAIDDLETEEDTTGPQTHLEADTGSERRDVPAWVDSSASDAPAWLDNSATDEESDDGNPDWPPELPAETCVDLDEWNWIVDEWLGQRMLWSDGDYLAGDDFLDDPPKVARLKLELMGIAHDYFTALPPDPADDAMEAIKAQLRELCGRAPV